MSFFLPEDTDTYFIPSRYSYLQDIKKFRKLFWRFKSFYILPLIEKFNILSFALSFTSVFYMSVVKKKKKKWGLNSKVSF